MKSAGLHVLLLLSPQQLLVCITKRVVAVVRLRRQAHWGGALLLRPGLPHQPLHIVGLGWMDEP